MKGFFITFEGIEGAGKSTQAKKLYDYLINNNKEAVLTREPGGTKLGKRIREILLSHSEEIFPPVAELLLYEADRNIHIHNIIKPYKEKGYYVVCDRFTDSTLAYQGYARGLDIKLVEFLNNLATEGQNPDITFLIDIPVEVSMQRIGNKKDRIENEGIEFHKRLREGFLEIAKKNSERIYVINGLNDENTVFEEIVFILKKKRVI
jgi:dTMP kinase